MNEIVKKMKFKDAPTAINAPADLELEFSKLGFATVLKDNASNKDVIVFVNSNAEFVGFLTNKLSHIEKDCVLWFAYPKLSSGIKTDINRDTLRVTAEEFGITTVTAISINDTWSALRFRPIDKVGK